MSIDTSFSQRDVRDPRKLAPKLDALAALVDDVAGIALLLTATDGEDGTAVVDMQVTDANGNDLSNSYLLRVWLADTVLTAPDATGKTAFAVGTGVEIEEVTAQADYRILTDATGTAAFTLTASDGTYYAMVEVNGKITTVEITVTGN